MTVTVDVLHNLGRNFGGPESVDRVSGTSRTLEMCADFRRGACHRGDRCKFSHDRREPGAPGVEMCADFRRGACFREHCRFSHGEGPKGQSLGVPSGVPSGVSVTSVLQTVIQAARGIGLEMCADFKRGACHRERCKFSHGDAPKRTEAINAIPPPLSLSSLSSLSLSSPSPSSSLDVSQAAAKAAAALVKPTPVQQVKSIEVGSDVQFLLNGNWTMGTALAYSADGEKLKVLTDSEHEATRPLPGFIMLSYVIMYFSWQCFRSAGILDFFLRNVHDEFAMACVFSHILIATSAQGSADFCETSRASLRRDRDLQWFLQWFPRSTVASLRVARLHLLLLRSSRHRTGPQPLRYAFWFEIQQLWGTFDSQGPSLGFRLTLTIFDFVTNIICWIFADGFSTIVIPFKAPGSSPPVTVPSPFGGAPIKIPVPWQKLQCFENVKKCGKEAERMEMNGIETRSQNQYLLAFANVKSHAVVCYWETKE